MTSIPGILIGDVLAGKYEVVDLIGSGGMGVVLEGVHRGLGQPVAIKVLRRNPKHDTELFARFAREARAAAQLKSRHTVTVTDVDFTDDGTPFMVMELLHGHDLDEELVRVGRLDVTEAVTYVLQTCTAMAEAHGLGIVHRDLKPQNLFLSHEGEHSFIKVLDFGISKIVDEAAKNITQTASALGTPLYMSPEQIRSAKHVDGRTDIWSLGVILYELLTSRPPFDAESPTAVVAAITADEPAPLSTVRPDVPVGLSDVVMRALQKRPDDRYPDIVAFAAALAPYGERGAFVQPSMRSLPEPVARPDASAPGFAATQRSDTHGSWETSPFRRPLKTTSKALIAAGVCSVLGIGIAWVATRGSEAAAVSAPHGEMLRAAEPSPDGEGTAVPPATGGEATPPAASVSSAASASSVSTAASAAPLPASAPPSVPPAPPPTPLPRATPRPVPPQPVPHVPPQPTTPPARL